MVPDDARQFFAMALTKLGYSPNSTNPDEIKAAYEELKKLSVVSTKPNTVDSTLTVHYPT